MSDVIIAKLDEMSQKAEANKTAIEQKFTEQVEGLKSEIKVVSERNEELKGELTELKKKQGALKLEPSQKSFNQVISESVEKSHDAIQKFIRKESKSFNLEIGEFNQKAVGDVSTANVTGGNVWGAQYRSGIIMNQNQIVHARQLLTVSNAGPGTDYYFMKENGAGEGAPANVAEKTAAAAATTTATGLLPAFDVDLVESSVKFETIGGVMPISYKALNNIPGLVSFLQKRIPEKLMDVEDAQIWYGDGASPNLKGILTAGNFAAGSAAGPTVLSEKIIADLKVYEDTYKRTANAIVMRPADYWSFFLQKASGSGEYNLPQNVVFVGGQLYIGGVPVYKTTSLVANDYVIGDFNLGAELLVQQGMSLEFFREDGNNIRTQQVTARILETVALPVFGNNFFLKGSSALA